MQGLKALGGVAAGHGEERSGAEKVYIYLYCIQFSRATSGGSDEVSVLRQCLASS